jgi:hypothetical protein
VDSSLNDSAFGSASQSLPRSNRNLLEAEMASEFMPVAIQLPARASNLIYRNQTYVHYCLRNTLVLRNTHLSVATHRYSRGDVS